MTLLQCMASAQRQRILEALAKNNGDRVRSTVLCQLARVTSPELTQHAGKMLPLGLISRRPDPYWRRRHEYRITAHGKRALEAAQRLERIGYDA